MRLKQKLRSIYAPVESSAAATAQPVDCAADHYVILMVCFVYTKNDEHTRESARYADHRYIVVIGLLLMAMTGRGSSRNPLEILCSRILYVHGAALLFELQRRLHRDRAFFSSCTCN